MVLNGEKEFAISGMQKGSVREETTAVSGTTVMSVQNRHRKPLHPIIGVRCGDSKGVLLLWGPANPSEVGVCFFWGIFCSFESGVGRHCHGTRKCPHRLSSDKLLRSAVPSQWRTNTGD